MNIKKNQHQVFRGYFRQFSELKNDNDLAFLTKQGIVTDLTDARSLTVKEYLYEIAGLDINELEDWFSKRESEWALALRRVQSTNTLSLDDFSTISEFAFYTAARTTEAIEKMAIIYGNGSPANGKDSYLFNISKHTNDALRSWLNSPVKLYGIVTTEGALSSDRPIIFGDGYGQPMRAHAALFHPPRSIVFPISSTKLFVAYTEEYPEEIIANHNKIQVWLAEDIMVIDKQQVDRAKLELSSMEPWDPEIIGTHSSITTLSRMDASTKQETIIRLMTTGTSEYYLTEDGVSTKIW